MSFALKKILCSLDLAKNARNLNSKICSCSLEFSSVFLIARKILARTRSARKLKFKILARNSLGSKMPLLVLLELENFSLGINTTPSEIEISLKLVLKICKLNLACVVCYCFESFNF